MTPDVDDDNDVNIDQARNVPILVSRPSSEVVISRDLDNFAFLISK